MKIKLQKITILLAIALALPGITSTVSFSKFDSNQIIAAETGGDSGSDKGGTSTKDGGSTKGGGSGGTLIDTVIDTIRTIFSGLGSGTDGSSA